MLLSLRFAEMFRSERFANRVFLAEPFAEVNQPAPMRAEWPVFSRKPVPRIFYKPDIGSGECAYLVSVAIVLMSLTTLVVASGDAPAPSGKFFWTSLKIVCCCTGERCELLKMA